MYYKHYLLIKNDTFSTNQNDRLIRGLLQTTEKKKIKLMFNLHDPADWVLKSKKENQIKEEIGSFKRKHWSQNFSFPNRTLHNFFHLKQEPLQNS